MDLPSHSNNVVLAVLSNNYTVSTTIKTVSTTILSAVKGSGEVMREDHKISNIVQKEIQTLSSILIKNESNVSQQHKEEYHFNSFRQYKPALAEMTADTATTTEESDEIFSCSACKFREELKRQNLALIMEHILLRLDMSQPPNITKPPPVSERVLDNFYSKNGNNYIRFRNHSAADPNNNDSKMQNDGPAVSLDQNDNRRPEDNDNSAGGLVPPTTEPDFSYNYHEEQHHQYHHHHHHVYHYQNRHTIQNNFKYDPIDDIEDIHARYSQKYYPENEYGDYDYDLSNEHGLVFNMDYFNNAQDDLEEEEDEKFYSVTDNLYLFPRITKTKINGDILEFTIKNIEHLDVNEATFGVFVRGIDWAVQNLSDLFADNSKVGKTKNEKAAENDKVDVKNSEKINNKKEHKNNDGSSVEKNNKMHNNNNGNNEQNKDKSDNSDDNCRETSDSNKNNDNNNNNNDNSDSDNKKGKNINNSDKNMKDNSNDDNSNNNNKNNSNDNSSHNKKIKNNSNNENNNNNSSNNNNNIKSNNNYYYINNDDSNDNSSSECVPSDNTHKKEKGVTRTISISINRFLTNARRQFTKNIVSSEGEIPKGEGKWIYFNITSLVKSWIKQLRMDSAKLAAENNEQIVIKTSQPWMRQLMILDPNVPSSPYIEIQALDRKKHRTKRQLSIDCQDHDIEKRCCRFPLRVDFRQFGWDWVLAPDAYEAYYCSGDCPIAFLPKHTHAYVHSLATQIKKCCSPRKLAPMSLLYYTDNHQIFHTTIPNMVVKKCGCS